MPNAFSLVHPPIVSMMSAGHSMASSLPLSLCRNEWITHPVETRGLNHLFNVALAEFELPFFSLQYPGKAYTEWDDAIFLAGHSEKPTNGNRRWLDVVFRLHHGCSTRSTKGVAASK